MDDDEYDDYLRDRHALICDPIAHFSAGAFISAIALLAMLVVL